MPDAGRDATDNPGPTKGASAKAVFSNERTVSAPRLTLPSALKPDTRLKMDGLEFLSLLPESAIPVAFLDPQYRGVLDKLAYGNEGKSRGTRRSALVQMPEETIVEFVRGIDRVLIPSGHLFLWVDKFHLCQGVRPWLEGTELEVVDLVTWDKGTFGMGYRTRRRAEHCVVLQRRPIRAKGVWKVHNITDVVLEKAVRREHPHAKPIELQGRLISAVSGEGDFVIDPAAGSFSVLDAAQQNNRRFLGCDLNG
ncbi:MAG: DNA methyltransferase [Boseongicola sp.]|nr:DNA methyltransferase [Boseongicola sp.]